MSFFSFLKTSSPSLFLFNLSFTHFFFVLSHALNLSIFSQVQFFLIPKRLKTRGNDWKQKKKKEKKWLTYETFSRHAKCRDKLLFINGWITDRKKNKTKHPASFQKAAIVATNPLQPSNHTTIFETKAPFLNLSLPCLSVNVLLAILNLPKCINFFPFTFFFIIFATFSCRLQCLLRFPCKNIYHFCPFYWHANISASSSSLPLDRI